MKLRLQKFLAEAGVASRRGGEALIQAGRVAVNGEVVRRLGTCVDPAHDTVTVDGRPLRPRRKRYYALHKPPGFLCTRQDERGRPTIYDLLPSDWEGIYSVGRLDFDSEGLILLTNDGEFALRLTHPRYGVVKKYLAVVAGRVPAERLPEFTRGVWHEGERLRARAVHLLSANARQSVVALELTEGKKREVRRLFAALGLEVKTLHRVQIGPIKLGELRPGKWRALTESEIKSLLNQPIV